MNSRKSKGNEDKLYNLVVNEEQLRLIAMCVEDCSRFAAGQFGMSNTTSYANIGTPYEFDTDSVREIENMRLIPQLSRASYLKYNSTPFVGNTYQIYREIYHYLAIKYDWNNVYSGCTLPSGNLGTITIEEK
jgi:hypothetical protein